MKLFNQYKGLRKEIYILFICKLIDNMGSMVGPMLTLILSTKIGLNAKEIAIISTVFMIIGLPITLIGGRICDRFNKKLILNVGDLTSSLIYIVCGFIGINKISIFLYYIGSIIQNAESSTYESLVADFSVGEDRDKASSLLYLGLNLGLMLAPTLGGLLLENHARLLFFISGISQLLSIIVFDIFVKDTTPIVDNNNKYENKISSTSTIKILKQNKIVTIYIAILSLSWVVYNMWGYIMPISLTDVQGSKGSIYYGTMNSLNCIIVVLCTVPITKLIMKYTSINRAMIGNTLEALGFLIFVIFIKTPFMYYVAITVFTLGEITNTITTTPHITKRIPINYRGRILAVSDFFFALFCAIGEFIVGFVYDEIGMIPAWTIIFVTSIITLIAYQLIKKPDRKQFPDLYKEK